MRMGMGMGIIVDCLFIVIKVSQNVSITWLSEFYFDVGHAWTF